MSDPIEFAAFDAAATAVEPAPPLADGDVHLWTVDLLAAPAEIERLGGFLADDERQRAARFHFDRHRRRFIVSQGMLRVVLARYLDRRPGEILFEYGPKGKPSLADDPVLHFNVSHSHERSVIAVSSTGALGVDIERVRHLPDADDIARRFFSRHEAEAYAGVAVERRAEAFFNCWTRKEAFIKALGEGLFLSLDRFDVSLVPGEPVEILSIDGDPDRAREWSLTELRPADGFAGALATPWSPSGVSAWHLPTHDLVHPAT